MIDYWNQTADRANVRGCSGTMGPSDQALAAAPSINGWMPPLIREVTGYGDVVTPARLATQADIDRLLERSLLLDQLLSDSRKLSHSLVRIEAALGTKTGIEHDVAVKTTLGGYSST